MSVKPIPDNYPRVIPYLAIAGAKEAIDWYCANLGFTVRGVMDMGGIVGHAELALGDSVLMLSDANPDWGNRDPKDIGGSPVSVMIYAEDVDAVYRKAVDAGATSEMEPADQFYGDRSAAFTDPFGHRWHVATHVEDVSEQEMGKRMEAMQQGG